MLNDELTAGGGRRVPSGTTGEDHNGDTGRMKGLKRPPKVAVTLAQRIVQEMMTGIYRPGSQLPGETEMVAHYQVGRGTLREALRLLELNGVIEMRIGPGGGPIATRPDGTSLASSMSMFLQLSRTTFGAIVQVRKVLEPSVTAMAAERMRAADLSRLKATVEAMEEGLEEEQAFLAANEEFHQVLTWGCGNTVFALLLSSLQHITDGRPLGVGYPADRRRSILEAHQHILEAVEARDPDAARERMATHAERYERYLQRNYPHLLASLLQWGDVIS